MKTFEQSYTYIHAYILNTLIITAIITCCLLPFLFSLFSVCSHILDERECLLLFILQPGKKSKVVKGAAFSRSSTFFLFISLNLSRSIDVSDESMYKSYHAWVRVGIASYVLLSTSVYYRKRKRAGGERGGINADG